MTQSLNDEGERRTNLSRIGITALNLFAPGLGLIRLNNWRAALSFLAAPFVFLALFTFGMGHFPITSYSSALFALVVILAVWALLYIASIVLTWRQSRFRSRVRTGSRWYVITFVAVAMISVSHPAILLVHQFYKPFYAPSESMAPTINKGDKFISDMRWRGPFQRGQIVIFKNGDEVRVNRIVAIPGDRVAMRGGVPTLNGMSASQSSVGQTTVTSFDGEHPAKMIAERLPDESEPHRVLDAGPTAIDDMEEVMVPSDHLFVLGDNRDNSADSRVSPMMGGVGMVPFSAVVGRPMYIHWSGDHARIGTRLDK